MAKTKDIVVPGSLLDEIVGPLWGKLVDAVVEVDDNKGTQLLLNIKPVGEATTDPY
jgi:hypothetical protein